MEDLKKKVQAMSAQNALLIFAGIIVVVLILFLVADQLKVSIFGQSKSFGKGTDLLSDAEGFGLIMSWVYLLASIGSIVFVFMKKQLNYVIAAVAAVSLIIAGFTAGDNGFVSVSPSLMLWLEFILLAAAAGFAYLRGNLPAELEQKK